MSVFECVGILWIIFTSLLATVGIFYLAWVGALVCVRRVDTVQVVEKESVEAVQVNVPLGWNAGEGVR